MQMQEQDNWCWAAVAVSVAQFYSSTTPWTQQCDVASRELAKMCCPAGVNAACDVPWYLDNALTRVGHFSTWTNGPGTLGDIQGEIDNGRPLGARIEWSNHGGHFVVVSGYSLSSLAGDLITVEDPITAQSTIPLAAFQSAYQGNGRWTHLYWTCP